MDKKLGFGCMRLPLLESKEINIEEFKKMVDYFIDHGFTYFDTAHGYHSGKSELALKEGLTKRYPRDRYQLTNKLSSSFFKTEEDIMPFFNSQLEACGVEYFDYYLMHAQSKENYGQYMDCHAYEVGKKLKEMGKIKHLGISFHDSAEFLEKIINEHPEIEIVQIQLNYYDYESANVQSRKCYEVLKKHNIPAIIMEPVKGGILANVSNEVKDIYKKVTTGSPASMAVRFAASFPLVQMVLSGMSNLDQVKDNVSYMEDFIPLSAEEYHAIAAAMVVLTNQKKIECTACRYCTDGCPKKIDIPGIFACYNQWQQFKEWNCKYYYSLITAHGGKASECIKCGKCENICPQHLKIRDYLQEISKEFD